MGRMEDLGPTPKQNPVQKLKTWIKAHPRKAAVIGVVSAVVLAVGGFVLWRYLNKQPISVPVITKEKPKEPTKYYSPLTGVETTKELSERPVRSIVIENSPEARPQSGLSEAGVVYESVSEGGITRYMAIFLDGQPKLIGPVRSLRSFFVSWTKEFESPIGHVGGNASAMDMLRPVGVRSLNQFFNSQYYFRAGDRAAPHNVYTTTELFDKMLRAKSIFRPANFTPSPRKDDEPPKDGTTVPHPNINVRFSYTGYDVRWEYNAAKNSYGRHLAGRPDKDRNHNEQIFAKNVVVMYMPTSYGVSRNGEAQTTMATIGSGKAVVFRDGKATVGKWSKAAHNQRTKLLDAAEKDISLNRGNTWYCVIPERTGSLTY